MSFVMPKASIVPSKQHIGFQERGFTRIHDLSKVTVAGNVNQHFFNIKSCVTVADGKLHKDKIPLIEWSGQLPRKNMTLAQATFFLRRTNAHHSIMAVGEPRSPYFGKAFQGATISPHSLWYVEPDDATPLNMKRPLLRTQESAYQLCKEPHWKIRMRGVVEKELLFATALSHDIVPFFVRNLNLIVLPVLVENDRLIMMKHDELLGAGLEAGAEWVRKAEVLFAKRSKDKTMTAQSRLNFQKLLTTQDPKAKHIVLYNKSGSNISAAYLSSDECTRAMDLQVMAFIAERVTYRIYTNSEEEASYLTAVLNSTVVNDAIKPYQTVGVYHGKRDITRRPFEVCPIEMYDPKSPLHQDLSSIAISAKEKMRKLAGRLAGTLAKVRDESRTIVRDEISRIDELVAKMFEEAPMRSLKSNPVGQEKMFGTENNWPDR